MALSRNPILDWDNARWREQAACRYTDANLFFPAGSTGVAIDQIEAAKNRVRVLPRRGRLPAVCDGDKPGSRHLGRQGRGRAPRAAQGVA